MSESQETKPLLHQAHDIINGDRQKDYGPPEESFVRIAKMWSAYLGAPIFPQDVVNLMVLLKVCRAKNGYHYDSYLDIAGYAGLAEMLSGP